MGYKDGNKKIAELGGITVNTVRYWRRSEAEYKESQAVSDGLKSLPKKDDELMRFYEI